MSWNPKAPVKPSVRLWSMVVLTIVSMACSSPGGENKGKEVAGDKNNPSLYTVKIEQMKFSPEVLEVHKGDTIMWDNRDMVAHNVTEKKQGGWSSSALQPGNTWKLVVKEDADYFCSIHPVMKGKLVLK